MSLRILHLDSGKSWRGGQRQVLLLATGLRDAGHEPLVLAPPDSPLIQSARAAGLAAAAVAMRSEVDLTAVRRVRRVLRTWRADIVHAHDARAHAIALLALAGGADVPLIVTRRVTFPPKWRAVKYGARVARFIAISEAIQNAMIAAGVPRERIDVVHSGLPPVTPVRSRNWRTELGCSADAVVCGVVGAMTAEKGVDAIEKIVTRLPDRVARRIHLLFLGGEQLATPEHSTIGGLHVVRLGFVNDVHSAMAGLDLLWHPAMSEGLGTVLIDALLLGVPPIAFAGGGVPEIIIDHQCGILVPPGDVDAFADAIVELVTRESVRASFAHAGPARGQHFSAERMIKGNEAVYNKVLKGWRRPSALT